MHEDETDIPDMARCGAYTPGHDVHFIQARQSRESGMGEPANVRSVDDDGTIHFADGSIRWNHDPDRLRAILDRHGNDVFVASHGLLRIPNERGTYLICVAKTPDPCRPETSKVIPGESIADEIKRRGGTIRRIVRTPDAGADE